MQADSVFVQLSFWALILFSMVLPICMFLMLHKRRAISPATVLLLGLTLVCISGADVGLLHSIQNEVQLTPSSLDDMFASEMAIGLYLVPALFGGIGINLITNVLQDHLHAAESRYAAMKNWPGNQDLKRNAGKKQLLLRKMFTEMVQQKNITVAARYYHPEFVLESNGTRQEYSAFIAGHARVYATAITYAVRYDEASWIEKSNKLAARMWITTQRPGEEAVEIEVVLIATFEGSHIKHLLELTWPDWTRIKAFDSY
jgi:hypothetical protein